VEDDDPISMEPIAELQYPPFNLDELAEGAPEEGLGTRTASPGGKGGASGEGGAGGAGGGRGGTVKFWFDGRLLAHWLVSTGTFTHPTTRQPVTRTTCARLDAYLARHRLAQHPAVTHMFDLCAAGGDAKLAAGAPSGDGDGVRRGAAGERERRRLAVATREALRRDASRRLEQFFAGGDPAADGGYGSYGSYGGIVDDDDRGASMADEADAARRRDDARSRRFLLHSTQDFPALPALPRTPPPLGAVDNEATAAAAVVVAAGARAAAGAEPPYARLTHWLDAADLHAAGGLRALEAALASFAPGAACALVPLPLWRSLGAQFPRRYSLATPDAASRFLVVDTAAATGGGGFGGGCPQVLDHLKRFASKVVTNDATGRCTQLLLADAAPALRDANAALVARRTQPYLLVAGSAFVLL
jgi:hypothetical protein